MTDFQVFNQSSKPNPGGVLTESITETNQIHLSYKDSVFSFEFAALHFSAPDSIKYAYKMEGFDKDWMYTDSKKRFATYTNLDGGSYIFRVKGTNSDGIWMNKSTRIKIKIEPPIWKTNWFYGSLVSMIFIVIGLTFICLAKLKREIKDLSFKIREVLDEY